MDEPLPTNNTTSGDQSGLNLGKPWIVNDTLGGYIVLLKPSHEGFNAWLTQQQKAKHYIARRRLLVDKYSHPLGQIARFPKEVREVLYHYLYQEGKIIPTQKPTSNGMICFDWKEYRQLPVAFLNTGWSAACDSKAYLYSGNTIVVQGEDTEGLEKFINEMPEEAIPLARSFYIQFSCHDISEGDLTCVKETAIANAQVLGQWYGWDRYERANCIHDAVRFELLNLWDHRFRLIDGFHIDDLTLDVCYATCPDGCCVDLAAQSLYCLRILLHGIPNKVTVVANDAKYGRKLKWLFRKGQRRWDWKSTSDW
ncbi:MAG: hypothetical protein LQ347_002744 [Umbilicaria vellea]|nr:MAG: hypothetical protein LQ347_002744 [Umbilicaria vellea]